MAEKKKTSRSRTQINSLRARAEAIIASRPEVFKRIAPTDIKELISELQTYEIELQMQNEELQVSRRALEEAKDKYQYLYDYAPCGYLTLTEKGVVQELNLAAAGMLGKRKSELVGKPLSIFLTNGSQRDFFLYLAKLMESGDKLTCELTFKHPRVMPFIVRLEGRLHDQEEGAAASIAIIMVDISHIKAAQEAILRESRLRNSLLENLPCMALVIKKGTREILFANKAAIGAGAVVGKTCYELSQRDQPCPFCRAPEAWDTNTSQNIEVAYDNKWLDCRWEPLDGDSYVHYIFDITQRKKDEIAFRESQERYRELVQNANSAIIRWKRDGSIVFANEYANEFFGYRDDTLVGKNVRILIPEKESTGVDLGGLVDDIAEDPGKYVNNVNENICRDGRRVWFAWTNKGITDAQGCVQEVLAVGSDITERKKSQEAEKQTLSLLSATLESTTDGILVIANSGKITGYNRKMKELWRIPQHLLDEGQDAKLLEFIRDQLKEPEVFFAKVKDLYTHPRQESFDIILFNDGRAYERYSQPQVLEGEVVGRVWSFRDITARRQMEAEIKSIIKFPLQNPDPVMRLASDGTILYKNPACLKLLCGLGLDERDIAKILPAGVSGLVGRVLSEKKSFETVEVDINGRWFLYALAPIPEEGYVNFYGREITSIKTAQRQLIIQEQMFRELFNNTNSCVVIYEAKDNGNDFVFKEFNPAVEKIEKVHRENIIGKSVCEVFPGVKEFGIFKVFQEVWRTGQPQYFPVKLYKDARVSGWKENYVYKLLSGEVVAAYNDITEQKKAEEEIRTLNRELEVRVAQRTAELELLNKELQAFSYSVSHDLRAPLRGMDGFSSALLEDYSAVLDEQGKDYLKRIHNAVLRMNELINDILKLSHSSNVPMSVEAVDLSSLAQARIAQLRQEDPGRTVTVVVAGDLGARGDKNLLEVALRNLIDNAWKFTRQVPAAHVEFGVIAQDGGRVYFVRDNGAGFDSRYAHKLFGAFQRLHSEKEFPGTGVGLVSVQRIIRRHGGKIWAESPGEGKGATFYFTLGQ